MIFERAINLGLVARDPSAEIARSKVLPKKLDLPTDSQFAAIVEALKQQESSAAVLNSDLVRFMAYSGLRLDEAKHVEWSDVDFERNRIFVKPGKNHHSRYAPITRSMRELLDEIRQTPRYSRSRDRREGNFVLMATECQRELDQACETVGAPRITHHDCQHLFATRCIESGIDILTVSRWLGHLDGGALAPRVYRHLRDEHSQRMAAQLNF
jgi:integrase